MMSMLIACQFAKDQIVEGPQKERTQVGADHIKGNDALNERKCLG